MNHITIEPLIHIFFIWSPFIILCIRQIPFGFVNKNNAHPTTQTCAYAMTCKFLYANSAHHEVKRKTLGNDNRHNCNKNDNKSKEK